MHEKVNLSVTIKHTTIVEENVLNGGLFAVWNESGQQRELRLR